MIKYKCLIAEDDLLDRDLLEMYLRRIPQLEITAMCENGLEAQQALAVNDIDLVFSDIDMPLLNGFGLLRTLKKAPVFIFISSHAEYAVESYNLDVVDFMTKPVSFERLLKSVNKATEYIELKNGSAQKQLSITLEKENYFFIRESNELVKLHFEEVAYIESMGDFSKIYSLQDKKHITLVSLKNLEQQLPADYFIRTHKQYIINHDHISAIGSDMMLIANKFSLPLSPVYRQELLDRVVNKKIVSRHMAK